MRVSDVMSTDVVAVAPQATLREVAETMARHRVSGMPVIDAGRLLGMISEADILLKEQGLASETAALSLLGELDALGVEEKLRARSAGEAMTAPVLTVEPSAPLAVAARLMSERGVNRLPVVEQGRVVGIVTRADLVRAFARSDGQIHDDVVEEVLRRVPGLETARIGVRVEGGQVTLSGPVPSGDALERVLELTSEIPGVVAVESRLQVSGAT